jgi:ATP-dependent 26S proteasome regulatory subunit
VVLATNLRKNLDDAFIRRIQHLVEFPFPDARMRERILRSHMPERAQVQPDVDLGALAQRLELSGGNIKNVVALATTLAVDAGEPIAMHHLVLGATRELQKLGKLPSKTDTRAVEALLGAQS